MYKPKITLTFSIIMSLLLFSCSEERPIKSITKVEYESTTIRAKNSPPRIKQITKENYDSEGNLIKKSRFNEKKKKIAESIYLYENGLLIKSIENNETKVFNYDSTKKIKSVDYLNRNVAEKYKYSNSLLIQKLKISSNNKVISETEYSYDNNKNIIKEKIEYGDYNEWYTYEYDNIGNLIKTFWFDSDEGPLEKTLFTYENEEMVKEEWYNYAYGVIEGSVVYHFENGLEKNIVETDYEDNSVVEWDFTYEFDSENNWIKKIEIFENNELTMIERLIEYY